MAAPRCMAKQEREYNLMRNTNARRRKMHVCRCLNQHAVATQTGPDNYSVPSTASMGRSNRRIKPAPNPELY